MSGLAWVGFLLMAGAGAATRSMVDGVIAERAAGRLPWGTITVNVAGSLLLGILTGMVVYHGMSSDALIILGAGFCGALTTFSTFGFETVRLMQDGSVRAAFGNLVVTAVPCGVGAAVGLAVMAI